MARVTKEWVRQELKAAAAAHKGQHKRIQTLVWAEAWKVAGHSDFTTMWEKENGFKLPYVIRTLAVEADCYHMNDKTLTDVAIRILGNPKGASTVSSILVQLESGIEPQDIRHAGAAMSPLRNDPGLQQVISILKVEYSQLLSDEAKRQGTTKQDLTAGILIKYLSDHGLI